LRTPEGRQHPLRWRFEIAAIRVGIAALDALPEASATALAAAGGAALSRVENRRRALALANLRLALPASSAAERRTLLRDNFAELARCASEWARLPSLDARTIAERVEIHGLEHIEAAYRRGRGVLVATAHYGHWELVLRALGLALAEREVTAVGREQSNPYLQAMVEERRRLGGIEPIGQRATEILRALRRNAGIGLLVDQYFSERRGGILVPFLGWGAWTNPGPATLSVRTGCALLVAHVQRVEGPRHRIVVEPELSIPDEPDRPHAIRRLTELINDAIGRFVLRDPVHWLWTTHRFRNSPDIDPEHYERARSARR
jgi:KDO2-lipid IV(A) lauroyltransferase